MSNKNRRKRKQNFLCVDCKVNTSKIKEHYFVNTELWLSSGATIHQQLCISCLEKRIGRLLNSSDFTSASINNPKHNEMSSCLLNGIRRKNVQ